MEIKQANLKKCEICETEATSLCYKCKSYYCDSCYKLIHDKKPKNDHKKEKIDYFVPIDIKCPDHPDNIINLFCIDEKGN